MAPFPSPLHILFLLYTTESCQRHNKGRCETCVDNFLINYCAYHQCTICPQPTQEATLPTQANNNQENSQVSAAVLGVLMGILLVLLVVVTSGWMWTCWTMKKWKSQVQISTQHQVSKKLIQRTNLIIILIQGSY